MALQSARVAKLTGNSKSAVRMPVRASATGERKPSPLEVGGTKDGSQALGKAVAKKARGLVVDGDFSDERWVKGTWDLNQFKKADGETDWDAVIDAEVIRRKWVEDRPEGSSNDDPVFFNLNQVPFPVWVKRFHFPEAEEINGRAAMVGFLMCYLWDMVSGEDMIATMDHFWFKILMVGTFGFCGFVRKFEDLDELKKLLDEATFYDGQWQATWKEGQPLPEDAAPGPTQQEDLANPPKMRK